MEIHPIKFNYIYQLWLNIQYKPYCIKERTFKIETSFRLYVYHNVIFAASIQDGNLIFFCKDSTDQTAFILKVNAIKAIL